MLRVRQHFPPSRPLDIPRAVRDGFAARPILSRLRPGARVAIGVGSRGITNLQTIVRSVVEVVRAAGMQPCIVPAMGSHGGATPEGQAGILAEYGITEAAVGAPVKPSLEVEQLGVTDDGVEVWFSWEALRADGIVLVNRIKPHTDFHGQLGSGILKMIAIGLGKRVGAATCHAAATRLGHERVLLGVARLALQKAPILGGLAILEDQWHQTARLEVIASTDLEARESALLREADRLLPRLPFDEIDLLIVDRLGKNISGAGMDPNVIGRPVLGYEAKLFNDGTCRPFIRRLFVRDLTPETHGNAIGIGFADFTTTRLVAAMNREVSYVNALTSLTPNSVKIPIHFDTDREAITQALRSLARPDPQAAKVVRIADTLSLAELEVSESFLAEVQSRSDLEARSAPAEMVFDAEGNLPPFASEVREAS